MSSSFLNPLEKQLVLGKYTSQFTLNHWSTPQSTGTTEHAGISVISWSNLHGESNQNTSHRRDLYALWFYHFIKQTIFTVHIKVKYLQSYVPKVDWWFRHHLLSTERNSQLEKSTITASQIKHEASTLLKENPMQSSGVLTLGRAENYIESIFCLCFAPCSDKGWLNCAFKSRIW